MEIISNTKNSMLTGGSAYYDKHDITTLQQTHYLSCSSDSTILIWS